MLTVWDHVSCHEVTRFTFIARTRCRADQLFLDLSIRKTLEEKGV